MSKRIKKYCFIFAMLLLFIPIAQSFLKLHISEKTLEGIAATTDFPTFRYADWMNGKYQQMAEKFIVNNFGFRNELLRTVNTIDYVLFTKSNSHQLLIGKDGYLFFNYNIERYLGILREDSKKIDSLVNLTAIVAEKLKHRNIDLVFAILPSNAFYYNDKFPAQYDKFEKRENDYDRYVSQLEKQGINYIDFNKWFMEMKDTAKYPLFPKTGTHYSYFSSYWVADSLFSYMESLKGFDIPDIIIEREYYDTMKHFEHDLENLLNIAHKLKVHKTLYYDIRFDTVGKTKPKVLTVGDSFFWALYNNQIPQNSFSNLTYWFYNIKVFPESFTRTVHPEEINLDKLFDNLDYIIIYASSTLLYHYDYDAFLGRINDYLDGKISFKNEYFNERLNFYIAAINNNPGWYNSIKTKSGNNNIPIDEQILIEAEWMVNQEGIYRQD